MNIKDIEELADDMVNVCVEHYGAKPVDNIGELLWTYIRQVLVDQYHQLEREVSSKQQALIRDMSDEMRQGLRGFAESHAIRKAALLKLTDDKSTQ